jgi:nicotinate-nucleotide adenylyltransferase
LPEPGLGLFGGAFDPPHRGHVALLATARRELGLGRVIVLVAADPGHKDVDTPAHVRLRLARAAFPGEQVELDPYARTIDLLHAHPEWTDAVFLIGADQFCDLPQWKQPDEVVRLVRLAVATRPGFPRERLDGVLNGLAQPERVIFFELDPTPVASRDLRAELASGSDVDGDIPPGALRIIRDEHLYAE